MASITENLIYNLMSSLKNDDLWVQFMEAIGEELTLERDFIFEKKELFNPNTNKQDRLFDLSEMFGYNPNLILNNSLEMLKSEYLSIPYRIRFKTTYDGYFFIFKQVDANGDVYNYYYDDSKLIKAMNYQSSIDKIMNGDYKYGDIFLFNEPDKNFSVISSDNSIRLDDENIFLDVKFGNYYWYLDKNVSVLPTKHLGIEYYPKGLMLNDNDEECIMNKYWFNYLEVGVEYTRRVPIVPHIGLQLSAVFKQNSGYNYLTPMKEYTIDDLKLNASTVFSFNKSFVQIESVRLDTNNTHLDSLNRWALDIESEGGEGVTSDSFKYICCGDGSSSLPNVENFNIFSFPNIVLFYTFDDTDDSNVITDYSNVSNNARLYGDTIKVKGITSSTINFNGSTYAQTNNPLNLNSGDTFSINFWLNPNNVSHKENTNNMCVFDIQNFLTAIYNYSDRSLRIAFDGNLISTVSVDFNEIVYMNIEFSNSIITVFKNGVQISSSSVSSITRSCEVYFGANSSQSNKYIGIFDSFYIMDKLFTSSEKSYIYENRLSIITHLNNFLARYELSSFSEIYENDFVRLIQSHVDALDVKEEFLFNTNDETDTNTVYMGTVKRTPLMPKYFEYYYKKDDDSIVKIKANESGEFYKEDGTLIRGDINYDSGFYRIYPFDKDLVSDVDVDISQYTVVTIEGVEKHHVVANLHDNIEFQTLKGSITLSNHTSQTFSTYENNISGGYPYIDGTINYETGVLDLYLDPTVENVSVTYSYFIDLEMKPNSSVFADYKIKEGYITEVGLENANHQLLAYMSFPKVEFNTIQDFISVGFYMLK